MSEAKGTMKISLAELTVSQINRTVSRKRHVFIFYNKRASTLKHTKTEHRVLTAEEILQANFGTPCIL